MPDGRALNIIAYDHLRGMIYNGEFEFGKIYSETKLAAQLNISRTPMRDALNRLATERYIDVLPNRGFVLHTPSEADVTEAYHVRMMIERYCGEILARHYPDEATEATVRRMNDALDRQRQILGDDDAYSLSRFWLDDLAFHRPMLEYMNIPSLSAQYDSFMHIFMPHHLLEGADIRQRNPRAIQRHLTTLGEHAAIVDALTSGDVRAVRAAIEAHLDSSMRAMFPLAKAN